MKLGVSYNLFDGEELLEGSIKSIRDNVDYISVVYQTISNFNNPCDEGLVPLLEDLKERGLIDTLYHYQTDMTLHCSTNEMTKRNIGLKFSKENGCTHHMSLDSDEFYTDEQLKFAKKTMEDGDFDSSACKLITYYKTDGYKFEPNEEWYVSLIFKINDREYSVIEDIKDLNLWNKLLVDPTRRMNPGNCKIFSRDEVEMHHMSHVRKDLRKKYNNSSAKQNFGNKVEGWVNFHNKFDDSMVGSGFPGNPEHKIIKTKKIFDLGEWIS